VFGGSSIQRGQDNPGLDKCVVLLWVNFQNMVQPARAVENKGISDCLTGETGPCPTSQDRKLIFRRQFDRNLQVVLRFGDGDTLRFDLVNGGVRAVKDACGEISADLAAEIFIQLVDEIGRKRLEMILIQNSHQNKR
jgi:hypothetical protein